MLPGGTSNIFMMTIEMKDLQIKNPFRIKFKRASPKTFKTTIYSSFMAFLLLMIISQSNSINLHCNFS